MCQGVSAPTVVGPRTLSGLGQPADGVGLYPRGTQGSRLLGLLHPLYPCCLRADVACACLLHLSDSDRVCVDQVVQVYQHVNSNL